MTGRAAELPEPLPSPTALFYGAGRTLAERLLGCATAAVCRRSAV